MYMLNAVQFLYILVYKHQVIIIYILITTIYKNLKLYLVIKIQFRKRRNIYHTLNIYRNNY